jgi:hypothetical protein
VTSGSSFGGNNVHSKRGMVREPGQDLLQVVETWPAATASANKEARFLLAALESHQRVRILEC